MSERGGVARDSLQQGGVEHLDMRGTAIIDENGYLVLVPDTMVVESVAANKSVTSAPLSSPFLKERRT